MLILFSSLTGAPGSCGVLTGRPQGCILLPPDLGELSRASEPRSIPALPAEPEELGRQRAGTMYHRDAGRKQAMSGAVTKITPGRSPAAPGTAPVSHGARGCVADAQRLLPIGLHHLGGASPPHPSSRHPLMIHRSPSSMTNPRLSVSRLWLSPSGNTPSDPELALPFFSVNICI